MLPDNSVGEVVGHISALSIAALLVFIIENEKVEMDGNKKGEAEAGQ